MTNADKVLSLTKYHEKTERQLAGETRTPMREFLARELVKTLRKIDSLKVK